MTETATEPVSTRLIATAAAIDIVSIVAFVAIGRKSHHESGTVVTGTAKIAAPFLIALVAGWLAARAWRAPIAVASGVIIWVVTIVIGMVLRKVAFDGGTAAPFIIVATLFTLLFLVGWRLLADWRAGRAGAAGG